MVTYWNANIDPGQGAATWSVGLNATGNPNDAITHYWASGAFVLSDLLKLVNRLVTLATAAGSSVTVPANFDRLTRRQQAEWVRDNGAEFLQRTGIKIVRDDNEGDGWSDPYATLAELGLKRIQSARA